MREASRSDARPGWRCAASRIASRRRRREAQGFAAGRDSAPRGLTSRDCLSAAPAGRVASFARGCEARASQRTPRAARGDGSGSPSLGYFSWRDKRSNSPAGARPGFSQLRPQSQTVKPDCAHASTSGLVARALRYLSANGWGAGRALRRAQRERIGSSVAQCEREGRVGAAYIRQNDRGGRSRRVSHAAEAAWDLRDQLTASA